jgi:hypothetical protein
MAPLTITQPSGSLRAPTFADAGGLPTPAPDRPDALAGLSIVMTCHDDEATAGAAVIHAARIAARTSHRYEIVVVDDASSDATPEVIAGLARPGSPLRAVFHPHGRGSDAAQRSGIAACSMPWVLLMDATDELDLNGLEDFLPLASRNDLLIGWRVMRRGPVAVRANAAAWNWLVRHTLGLAVWDIDCPLKLVRRDLLERLDVGAAGTTSGAEIVVRAQALNARVAEVNVRQRAGLPGSGKSGASPHPSPSTLLALARLRRGMPDSRAGHQLAGPAIGLLATALVAGVS